MKRYAVWLLLLGLIGAGYFGPWVAHPAAGLNLSADDLAEFVKFLPVVRSGELAIIRELFFVPIWITALGLGLVAGRVRAPGWRLGSLALSLLLVFTPLPPFTFLQTAYRSPEFGLTFWTTGAVTLATLGLALGGRRLADRLEAGLWIVLGLAAASIAPLHFVKAAPEIERLYPFAPGWGLFAVVVGGLGLVAAGARLWLKKRNRAS